MDDWNWAEKKDKCIIEGLKLISNLAEWVHYGELRHSLTTAEWRIIEGLKLTSNLAEWAHHGELRNNLTTAERRIIEGLKLILN